MIRQRRAVRAILITPERETLLICIRPPQGGEAFWITPGGGLEPGETVESGLRRELGEELGLGDFVIGPLVWRRRHTFDWGDERICQSEQLFIVHVERFESHMSDEQELKVVEDVRWWPVSRLSEVPGELTPAALGEILARYLAEGPPRELPPVEVLVD